MEVQKIIQVVQAHVCNLSKQVIYLGPKAIPTHKNQRPAQKSSLIKEVKNQQGMNCEASPHV